MDQLMERSQLFDLMGGLKLYGMKAAFDENMATAIKRQHEPQRIVGDLLNAQINEKQVRSIKYQLTIAKLPLAKDLDDFEFDDTPINETLVRDRAGGEFIAQQRNAVLVGGTGTGKTHLAIARSCIRSGSRGRFYNVVDLVNRLEIETRNGRQGRIADQSPGWTSSFSMSSAICRSLNPEGNSYSTSSAASTSAPQASSLPTSHSANGRASSVIPR
jgi:DNA replication protein DnaC